ncbi:MAG TPA: zf-HC2 domain-containing protein [Gemmataceae bacterium]|jgi:hypothetical protein|nr:zf-HC2 domain-containing protein [Gemmataceae bacterium]
MLSERVQELLSAAVDGELTPRQREAVEKLLRESSEARELFEKMKQDAATLQHMRKVRLSADYPAIILKRVAERKPSPARSQNPIARWMPVWANAVAGVAVIVAICGATTLAVIWNEQQKKEQQVKNINKNMPEKTPAPRPVEDPFVAKAPVNTADEPRVEKVPLMPMEMAQNLPPPSAVKPDEPKPALTGPGNSPIPPLTQVPPPKTAPILLMKDLDQPATRQKLLDALKADPLVQIDLFCKDSFKATEKLQGAFKGQKIVVDAVAQECLKLKVAKVQFAFYVENLTPEEIERILQAVAAEERRSESRQFDKLVLKPLAATQLKTMLGVEPKWLQSKPVPSAKPYENFVLLLASGKVVSNPATSKEIKHFVETRKDRRPGSVPVLISVRESE